MNSKFNNFIYNIVTNIADNLFIMETEFIYDEGSIMELAEKIFNDEPKNAHSYRLEFDAVGINMEDIHKELLMFFTYGMKKMYGDENGQVNLKTLSQEQLNKINKYLNMIGVKLHYQTYMENEHAKMILEHFSMLNSEKKSLEDFRFKIKSEDIIYVIYFSVLLLSN